METKEQPFKIRFYKGEWFDAEQLFIEASADCLLSEVTFHITTDNHPAESLIGCTGSPSKTYELEIFQPFYEIMKEIVMEDSSEEKTNFIFHISTTGKTAETPARPLETNHTVRVKNPLIGMKREDWPEWEEPQFDLPEFIDRVPQKEDFIINVSPQYTDGDMWDFLDETMHFDLLITSDKPLKKIEITTKLMHEWREDKTFIEVSPEAQSHKLKIEPSVNLLDQIKDLGSFNRSMNENFDYFFTLEMTDAENKKYIRKVSAILPNPYYEEINAEKQIARETLAEVFQKRYGEDIAELKIEEQTGWWRWEKDDATYQYGWEDDCSIVLYRYFGTADYDADPDEVSAAMKELTNFSNGAGKFIYVDNYYVLKATFSSEWIEPEDLEKKLDEFEKFAESDELADFLAKYEE